MILLVFDTVLLLEAFDPSCGVYKLLLTGEEGVAGGADFHLKILCGGTGFNLVSASALDGSEFIIRMNIALHCISPIATR